MTVEEVYWENRYLQGGNSGLGSFGSLRYFKAEVVNSFIDSNQIKTVLEFGCGDGLQLAKLEMDSYIGIDISLKAIQLCKERFKGDETKRFLLSSDYVDETAELTLSLDVIYHILEDNEYERYMQRLFNSSTRYVIIYSSDFEDIQYGHERRRQFTKWVTDNATDWKLLMYIPNEFPYNTETGEGSLSSFFIYKKG